MAAALALLAAAHTRRAALCGMAGCAASLWSHPGSPASAAEEPSLAWGPMSSMSTAEVEALDVQSRDASGVLTPDGVRVIDLVEGNGAPAEKGNRVYCHYKIWARGFHDGPVADFTYLDGRPYDWFLGFPNERIPTAVDASLVGMREGGWRRLIVPNAYPEGLRRINRLPGGGRYTPPKAGYVVKPGAFAFFDIIMMDSGSGRCDALLSPMGMSEEEARKLRTMNCVAEELKTSIPGVGTALF